MSSVILDDRNPSIVYSSGWNAGGLATEYNSTTTYTNTGGATVTLTFNGVRIGVYGTIGSSNSNKTAPQSQYQLDENQPLFFIPKLHPLSQRNQQFYQSPELPKEQHTLIVTNLINGSSLFALDYFVIVTGNTADSVSSGGTPTGVSTSKSSRKEIIAGTVASVVACILLLLGILFLWRRRQKRLENEWNLGIVPIAWEHTSDTVQRTPVPPSDIRIFPTGKGVVLAGRPITSALSPSAPSTSYHPPSSTNADDLVAPPEYKP